MAQLPPEIERAAKAVARRGAGERTARYLAAKGFSDDVVYAIVAHDDGAPLG